MENSKISVLMLVSYNFSYSVEAFKTVTTGTAKIQKTKIRSLMYNTNKVMVNQRNELSVPDALIASCPATLVLAHQIKTPPPTHPSRTLFQSLDRCSWTHTGARRNRSRSATSTSSRRSGCIANLQGKNALYYLNVIDNYVMS